MKHSHLQIRRSTYFMRRRIPQDLKEALGRGEIIESLQTKDRAEAKRRLNARLVELDQEWAELRHRLALAQADPEGAALAELQAKLAADHQARLDGSYRRHQGTVENDPNLAEVELHEAMERLAEATSRGRPMTAASLAGLRAEVEYWQTILGRLSGRWHPLLTAPLLGAMQSASQTAAPRKAVRPAPGPGTTIRQAWDQYVAVRQPTPVSIETGRTMIDRWVKLHGDLCVAAISRQDVRAFRDHLAQLPGRSGSTLAAATVRRNLGTLSALLGYCEEEDLIQANPCRGVKVHDPEQHREKRLPYDQADLELIFRGPVHALGERPKGGGGEAAYWLPLLSLWTGARLEELGQLLVSDVKQEGGISFLDLNTLDPSKRLKSKAARRQIPLHTQLRQLGFLDYVAKRRAEDGPDAPLWPLLQRNRSGKLTAGWSRWWSQYGRGTLGLVDRRKSFHSLRHTHRDAHRVAGLEEALSDQMMGHSSNGRSQGRSYGRGYALPQLAEAIELLRLPGGLELSPMGDRPRAPSGPVEQP